MFLFSRRFAMSGSVGTIMLETLTSLESGGKYQHQNNPEVIQEFLDKVEEFELTDTEKMVNYHKFFEANLPNVLLLDASKPMPYLTGGNSSYY
jgi:hypothetical protein